MDQKRKEQLSNARNLCAEIEQYPENYTKHSQEERRKLTLETEVKEIYTDAFVFSKKKKNNAVPNPNNSIHVDKPRKVYKRTKENEKARRNAIDADSHMQKIS